jgi:hypothetical protein
MIQHLILLVIQLLAVLHILPFTTTTNTKMLANWFNSMFRKFMKVNCFSFVVALRFLNVCTSTTSPGTTFGIKLLYHPAPLLPIRLFQHQGLLFDERQLCLFFLAIAQNKRLNGFINSNWDFF